MHFRRIAFWVAELDFFFSAAPSENKPSTTVVKLMNVSILEKSVRASRNRRLSSSRTRKSKISEIEDWSLSRCNVFSVYHGQTHSFWSMRTIMKWNWSIKTCCFGRIWSVWFPVVRMTNRLRGRKFFSSFEQIRTPVLCTKSRSLRVKIFYTFTRFFGLKTCI